jgi:2-amino-4-hydroxy-6-hydroxymethyldihydropteridine diphosphokinase
MVATTAYLGLGSNKGRSRDILRAAARAMHDLPGIRVEAVSQLYRTRAVGARQRDFINAAIRVTTILSPERLLSVLKGLEQRFGRLPAATPCLPRELDVDILFYGSRRIRSIRLTVPHPRFAERRFVLEPLVSLSPALKNPVTGTPLRRLRDALRVIAPHQRVVRLAEKTARGCRPEKHYAVIGKPS